MVSVILFTKNYSYDQIKAVLETAFLMSMIIKSVHSDALHIN